MKDGPSALVARARNVLGDGLLLAAVSAGGYLAAHAFKSGYLAYLGVPAALVTVDPVWIIVAATAMPLFLFPIVQGARFTAAIWIRARKPRIRAFEYALNVLCGTLLISVVSVFLLRGGGEQSLRLLIILVHGIGLAVAAMLVLLPIAFGGRGSWRRNLIRAYKDLDEAPPARRIPAKGFSRDTYDLSRRLEIYLFYAVAVVVLAKGLAEEAGRAHAKQNADWMLVHAPSGDAFLVADVSSLGFTLVKFDVATQRLQYEIQVLPELWEDSTAVRYTGRVLR